MEPKYKTGDLISVYADWVNTEYYFLIEDGVRLDINSVYEYPYYCLNDGTRGWGNFAYFTVKKVA